MGKALRTMGVWLGCMCVAGQVLAADAQPQPTAVPALEPPRLLQRVRVGSNPISVAATQDGQFVYAANSSSDSISKVSTTSLQVVSTIEIDGTPVSIALIAKQLALCVTARDNRTLNLVSQKDNYVLKSIELPYAPEKVVVHPDGKWAYVGSSLATYLMVVDLEKKQVVQNITTNGACVGLAITPDGSMVLVSTRSPEFNLNLVSTQGRSVADRTQAGSVPVAIAVSPAGEYAYVANRDSNDLTMVHVPTHHAVMSIPVGQGPTDLAFTPSGKFIYVACQLENSVAIVDAQSNSVACRIPLEIVPWGIAFSPDGARAYIANYKNASTGNRNDWTGPQRTMGTTAGDRVNNNILLVYQTQSYH